MDFEGMKEATQPATSVPSGIFKLPVEIRHSIYARVLVVPHPLYLFQDTGSQIVETFAPEKPHRWLALLHTNKQVHDEACAVLYSLNHFALLDTTHHQHDLLSSFLTCIGARSAGLIAHLSINFPVIITQSPGSESENQLGNQKSMLQLGDDDRDTLKLLREKFPNLTTLETIIHSRNSNYLFNTSPDNVSFIQEALPRIDASLKTIPSLQNIIVRCFDGTPVLVVKEMMQIFGWVILPAR